MITARTWGFEDLVCPWGRRVSIPAQSRGPLHVHDSKEEVILVVEGLAWIESGKDENSLSGAWIGDNGRIAFPCSLAHRITALRDVLAIEFSPNSLADSREILAGGKVGEAEFGALLAEFYRRESRSAVIGVEEAGIIASALRKEGRMIGMCSGAFDLLHLGHVELLQQARQRCEVLFVAVASDAAVAALRPGRPFIGQKGRTGLVAATKWADYVVLTEGKTCADALKAVRPHSYITTTEYGFEGVETKEAAALGIAVHVVGTIPGFSTSNIAATVAAKEKAR